METRKALIGGALLLAALVYVYSRDQMPVVNIDPRSLVDHQYDPFVHWRMQDPADYFRPHPVSIGPNCLPLILQNVDIGKALQPCEVERASYPQ
jgi:hypothetical protein